MLKRTTTNKRSSLVVTLVNYNCIKCNVDRIGMPWTNTLAYYKHM
jgi:hypothetical protein